MECRYHPLLGVSIPHSITDSCNSGAGDETTRNSSAILHYVYSCLFAQKVSPKVCSCILAMTVNLLSDWELTETDEQEMKAKLTMEVTKNDVGTDENGTRMDVAHGPDLVLPFIPILLGYMSIVIEGEGKRVRVASEPTSLHLEFTVISR